MAVIGLRSAAGFAAGGPLYVTAQYVNVFVAVVALCHKRREGRATAVSVRHALLALLTESPMSGYDLAKVLDRSVAFVWHAPHSQIYPLLRKMALDGLLDEELLPRGETAVKRIYSITERGRLELARWVAMPEPIERLHDVQRLRATYLEFARYEDARAYFRAHRDHYRVWQDRWALHAEQIAADEIPFMRKRIEATGSEDAAAAMAYKVHVYEGLAAQAGLEAEWAERGLELVKTLENGNRNPYRDCGVSEKRTSCRDPS